MPALWTKGGKLLVNSSGALIACDECPCDKVPDDCPSTLPDEYSLTAYEFHDAEYSPGAGDDCSTVSPNWTRDYRINPSDYPITLSRVGTTCEWSADVDIEVSEDGGSYSYDHTVTISVKLGAGQWEWWEDGVQLYGIKAIGFSPAGDYPYDSGPCVGDGMTPVTKQTGSITVE